MDLKINKYKWNQNCLMTNDLLRNYAKIKENGALQRS